MTYHQSKVGGGAGIVANGHSAVATCHSHESAEEAVQALARSGFDMKRLSIVGKGYHSEDSVEGFYNAGDRMKYWGTLGAFWGGLWGFLFGSAFFWVPGIGPLAVGGPLVSWVVGALEGAAIIGGMSAIGAGLYSIGIPKDSVLKYETAIKNDKYLIVVHGTPEEVEHARVLLHGAGIEEIDLHVGEKAHA